ncbi:MAG: hypothetical protein ABJ308_17665 [Halieaceae bacterium]
MVEKRVMSCAQCRDVMRPARASRSGKGQKFFALIIFFTGLGLLAGSLATALLAIPSVLLLAAALWIAFRRMDIWKCQACGHVLERGRDHPGDHDRHSELQTS